MLLKAVVQSLKIWFLIILKLFCQTVGASGRCSSKTCPNSNMTSAKVIWLMECHRAISLCFYKKRWMFTKTQRSAERSIYFPDNSAESILALLLRDSHSTAIHLYATGFIYTLQTFIKANLMGVKKREKEYTKNLMKTQLLQGADSV